MFNNQWWKDAKQKLHQTVSEFVSHLDNNQHYRTMDNVKYARLYGNYDIYNIDTISYARVETSYNVSSRITLNVIQSMIDTVVSKITKNKPSPMFLTDGGNWSNQQKAKKLTKFCEGVFYSVDLYSQATKAFTDACIFGTGALKFYIQDGCIKAERVFIDEIKVSDTESFYGKPRQLHQIKWVNKDVLAEKFPKYKVSIEKAAQEDYIKSSNTPVSKDMVRVVESWHLPSGPNADDGKHAITISQETLMVEEYKKMDFPFVFFRWCERPVGFYGQGIAEQLQGIQLEINKILRTIQVSMHLVSIPKVFVEAGSKVVDAHLNNRIGGIVTYAGTPPIFQSLGQIPPDLYRQLEFLYNKGFEIVGVSQLAAQAQKPAGLNSGKALRVYNDIESERFLTVGRRYEQAFMDCAKLIIEMARELYEDGTDVSVKVKGRDFIESIKWSEVDLSEDMYIMQCFPVSALSATPSARLEEVQEYMAAGMLTQEEGRKLLDFPDLKSINNLHTSPLDDIMAAIENMIDKGMYETPEPYQDLEYGINMCQKAYLYYRRAGAPEERLELLRRWIEDAGSLLQKAVSEAEQQQMVDETSNMAVAQDQVAQELEANPVAGMPTGTPTDNMM